MVHKYRTIGGAGEAEIVVKKSRFIGQASPATSEEQALAWIGELKKRHYEARHNCHAWIISPLNQRSSDDGEPAGTAGRPMLEVLRKEGLEQVVVVVTRYFGGVLLGANGLIRAYAQACKAALVAAGMGWMLPHRRLMAVVDYPQYGKLENQLRERQIAVLASDFGQQVTLTLGLPTASLAATRDWLADLTDGQAKVSLGLEYYNFIRGGKRIG